MIKIKSIEIGSYKLLQNTTLDLTGKEGIITLQGNNLDSPANFSANSVGKSTLTNSVLHCLFGKNLQGESLEKCTNLYTNQKPNVTITMDIGDVEYVIKNNYQDNYLKVYKEGLLLEITGKNDTFKEVETVLGLNHFLMSNLIYISPSSNSLFSSAGNDAQSKFIQKLLNIDFIEGINKKANIDLKSYKGELGLKVKELTMFQQQIDNINKQLELVPEIEHKDFDEDINRIGAEIVNQENLRSSIKKTYDKEVLVKDAATKDLIETKSELKHLEIALKNEEGLIAKGQCPTCSQDTAHLELKTDKKAIRELKQSIIEKEEKELEVKTSVKSIEKELSDIASQIMKDKSVLDRLKKDKEAHLKQKSSEEVRQVLLVQRLEAIANLVELQSSTKELEDKVYCLDLIVASTSSKGFVKERIDLFLKLFNLELKKLGRILLGKMYDIEIVSTKANNYELVIDDGDISLNYLSMSSGWKSRLDILLILALNKSVEILTGISVNILVLDEILSAIDANGIESVAKMLEKVQQEFPDKSIFVVSHNQELKLSSATLCIERKNDISKFKWLE